MLAARCANALVLWRFVQPVAGNPGVAHCLNDGFDVAIADRADATFVAVIQAMATHTASVGGAIGQVFEIAQLT